MTERLLIIGAYIVAFFVVYRLRQCREPSWENQMIDFELRQLKRALDEAPAPILKALRDE